MKQLPGVEILTNDDQPKPEAAPTSIEVVSLNYDALTGRSQFHKRPVGIVELGEVSSVDADAEIGKWMRRSLVKYL